MHYIAVARNNSVVPSTATPSLLPWRQRLPRKPRQAKQGPSKPALGRGQPRPPRRTRKRKLANAPQLAPHAQRARVGTGADAATVARLEIGQTEELRAALHDTRLFQLDAPSAPAAPPCSTLAPRRGLQATLDGLAVHILDTFMSYNVFRAAVAHLRPHRSQAACCVLGRVETVRADTRATQRHFMRGNKDTSWATFRIVVPVPQPLFLFLFPKAWVPRL